MQIEQVIKKFNSKSFRAFYFKSADEAKAFIGETIGSGSTIGMGGSVTISELGLYDFLSAGTKV